MGNKGNADTSSAFNTVGTHLGNTAGVLDKASEFEHGISEAAAAAFKGTTGPRTTTPGALSAFGNMITATGKLAGGEWAQGGLELGGSFFDMAAVGSESTWLGPAGAAARGASAGYTMYENWDQCSADAGWTDNKCFTAAGDMAFAGAEVAAPVLGSAVKFGLDGLGALAGWIDEDWGFSSGSVAGGVIHGGAVAADAAGDAIGSAMDWMFPIESPTPVGTQVGTGDRAPRLDRQGVNRTCAGASTPAVRTPPALPALGVDSRDPFAFLGDKK